MSEQKDKIIAGAKQYAEYIISQLPQKDENGNVKYYFSGSLAMLLLNSAQSVRPSFLDTNGSVVKERQEFSIPSKNKEFLLSGVRQIGKDIDVVAVDDNTFTHQGSIYELNKIKEKCNLATTLCPAWETLLGTTYFDYLADERMFSGFDVAELIMQDGSSVIVADPLCMVVHKFADSIKCQTTIKKLTQKNILTEDTERKLVEKYEKDIKDFSSMFNGIVPLYPNIDFKQVLEHILATCPDTSLAGVMKEENIETIRQFWIDAKKQIDDEYQNLFGEFIGAVKQENKNMLNSAVEQSLQV